MYLHAMHRCRRKRECSITKSCDHEQTGAAKKAQEYMCLMVKTNMTMIEPVVGEHDVNLDKFASTTDCIAQEEESHRVEMTTSPYDIVDQKRLNFNTSLNLLNLPVETISHILSFLDSEPPSHRNRLQQPTNQLTRSSAQPLKHVSLTCKRLRILGLQLLFKNTRLDPYDLTNFLSFISTHSLSGTVTTLTAHLQGPCSHIHPAWWARILNKIPALQEFTIQAAPHVFSELIGIHIDDTHAWAFNMPLQTMTLSQSRTHQRPRFCLSHEEEYEIVDYNNLPNLLTAKDWTSLTFNEGSSILAYSTYEYFLKRTPSLFTSLYTHSDDPTISSSTPPTASPSPPSLPSSTSAVSKFYKTLESFSFVAIFPFYNHMDEILKSIRQMKNLKYLFIKICPEPESTVLHDELDLAKGHIDVNDPWNEFDTAYHLLAHTVRYLYVQGQLQTFQVDDVKMHGVRDSLIESLTVRLESLPDLVYAGDGVWTKRPSTEENVTATAE